MLNNAEVNLLLTRSSQITHNDNSVKKVNNKVIGVPEKLMLFGESGDTSRFNEARA
jgi:hypothetical protein